jgi:hypothetical protein
MTVATACSDLADTAGAIAAAYRALRQDLGGEPDLVVLYHTLHHSADAVAEATAGLPRGVRVHGGTTFRGLLSDTGVYVGGPVIGLMGIGTREIRCGTALAAKGDDPRTAAIAAVHAALADAGRQGEVPDLVLLCGTVGGEEETLAGIASVLGARVPVFGATAGGVARDVASSRVLVRGREQAEALAIAVVFSAQPISRAFHAGCVPTHFAGIANLCEGRRVVHRIGGASAAEVYADWVLGQTGTALPADTNSLHTALAPLGREVGRIGEFPLYALTHVDELRADGALVMMTDVAEGDELRLMVGERSTLVGRPARAVEAAITLQCADVCAVSGGLIAVCAGLAALMTDDLREVQSSLRTAMLDRPFLAPFTFGEQGNLTDSRAVHANLMVASLIWGG